MDQQRQRGDAGVGLVEVIVGMLIASVAMAALAQTLVLSVSTQRGDRQHAVGHALGVAELETMQTLPWALVGHYDADPGVAPGSVRLAATRPAGSRAPLPQSLQVERAGTRYDVRREVRLYNDPATNLPTDYKQLTVTVSWQGARGPKTTRIDSIRTPKVGELAPSDFSLRRGTATPTSVSLSASGQLDAQLTLSAELTNPGTSATVEWTDRDGALQTRSMTTPDGGRSFTATLAAATCCFASADTAFVVRATRASPGATVLTTITVPLLQPLSVDSATATQCPPVSGVAQPVRVTSATTGTQAADAVVVEASTGGTWTLASNAQSASGNTWTTTVPATSLSAASTLTVRATRQSPTTTTVSSAPLTVTEVTSPC